MLEAVYLVGCVVFVGIYGYWCQTNIKNKATMFFASMFGGFIIGAAIHVVLVDSVNNTSSDVGFWMEAAKMQIIDIEQKDRSVFEAGN